MMLDLAEHYNNGPVQMAEIARRQDLSGKYLQQLIIPLKKVNLIRSVRGPKGGHMLARPPEDISIGEIVRALEGGIDLADCIERPEACDKSRHCAARDIWEEVTKAMYDKLDAITLSKMLGKGETRGVEKEA